METGSGPLGQLGELEVLEAISATEVAEMDMPHVMITRVRGREIATYSGPFPSGLAALEAAECEHRLDQLVGSGDLEFQVAPLYATLDSTSGVAQSEATPPLGS